MAEPAPSSSSGKDCFRAAGDVVRVQDREDGLLVGFGDIVLGVVHHGMYVVWTHQLVVTVLTVSPATSTIGIAFW